MDKRDKIIQTYADKEQIEKAIFDHNTCYCKTAYKTEIFKDKIYNKLRNDKVRNSTLDGNLDPNECGNKNMCKFLKLLKQLFNSRKNENR